MRATAAFLLNLILHGRAQIRVMSPEYLVSQLSATNGRIEGSTATFGAPFYGERILGRLVWGDSLHNNSHCTEADYDVPPPDQIPSQDSSYQQVRLIHIIMVRRGKCSFVTKVRVATNKGAHAVVIVDTEDSNKTANEIRRIIVADDGFGVNVDVPSILISKQEGAYLIDAAKKSQVIVELAWDIPANHVVIVDLWMSSASRESMHFMQEFSKNRKALNEAIKFVPHYHVFGMQSTTDYNNLCTDVSAQYCAEDPDGSGPITGRMVLEEDVRQLCIHELTKVVRTDLDIVALRAQTPEGGWRTADAVEYAAKYWDYVEKLATACPLDAATPAQRFGRECSEAHMKRVGIDVDKVDACVISTRDDKLKEQRANIAWSPRALRINGWRYSGTLDADLVTRAICAGFVKQPPACSLLVEPGFISFEKAPEQGVGFFSFFMALLLVAAVIVGALLLYKRSLTRHIHTALREEVMLEVQSQMDTYRQMPS